MSRNGPKSPDEVARLRTTDLDCSNEPSMTVQADANEADINKIIKRFEKAGMVTRLNSNQPFFGDVSEFDGLQDAIIKVEAADERFMALPADIRERFSNDPVELVQFLSDTNNRPEAEKLGLVLPQKTVEPAVPATPPPAPAGGKAQ